MATLLPNEQKQTIGQPSTDLGQLFNPDLYPWSKSQSNSTSRSSGTSLNNSTSNSSTGSQSSANNFSGLDAPNRNAIMGSVTPAITDAIGSLSGLPDKYANAALGSYRNLSRDAISKALPQQLEALASKGMVNSSTGEEAIRNAMRDIAMSVGDKGYGAQMDSAQMAMQIPSILANIGQLGQYSQGSSSGSSSGQSTSQSSGKSVSQGESDSTSTSASEQPNVPYADMMNFILGLNPTMTGV